MGKEIRHEANGRSPARTKSGLVRPTYPMQKTTVVTTGLLCLGLLLPRAAHAQAEELPPAAIGIESRAPETPTRALAPAAPVSPQLALGHSYSWRHPFLGDVHTLPANRASSAWSPRPSRLMMVSIASTLVRVGLAPPLYLRPVRSRLSLGAFRQGLQLAAGEVLALEAELDALLFRALERVALAFDGGAPWMTRPAGCPPTRQIPRPRQFPVGRSGPEGYRSRHAHEP
jgi:hypothetical protein